MTNKEVFVKFSENYPNIKVNDYRPIAREYTSDLDSKQGIVIWAENGDTFLYFPAVSEHKE